MCEFETTRRWEPNLSLSRADIEEAQPGFGSEIGYGASGGLGLAPRKGCIYIMN
jgi:hypothetical protein